MNKIIILLISLLVALAAIFFTVSRYSPKKLPKINSFQECARAGYPVMESYPRQCSAPGGRNFVESLIEENRP